MNTDSQWSKQEACFACASITTPVSLLGNEFDVQSVLHRQVSLAAVNQIYVIHEAMNGCKKYKDSLKDCFKNVNIKNEYICEKTPYILLFHFISGSNYVFLVYNKIKLVFIFFHMQENYC